VPSLLAMPEPVAVLRAEMAAASLEAGSAKLSTATSKGPFRPKLLMLLACPFLCQDAAADGGGAPGAQLELLLATDRVD